MASRPAVVAAAAAAPGADAHHLSMPPAIAAIATATRMAPNTASKPPSILSIQHTKFLDLPTELQRMTLNFLDMKDLNSVALTARPLARVVESLRWGHLILDTNTAYKGRSTDASYVARHLDESTLGLHKPAHRCIHVGKTLSKSEESLQAQANKRKPGSKAIDGKIKPSSVNDFILDSVHSSNTSFKGKFDDLFRGVQTLSIKIPLFAPEFVGDPNYMPRRKVIMKQAPLNTHWFLTHKVPALFMGLRSLNFEMIANSKYEVEDMNPIFISMMETFGERIKHGDLEVSVNFEVTRKSRLEVKKRLPMEYVKNLRIYYKVNQTIPKSIKVPSTTKDDVARTIEMMCGGARLPDSVERFELIMANMYENAGGGSNTVDNLPMNFFRDLLSEATNLKSLTYLGFRPVSNTNDTAQWLPDSVERLIEEHPTEVVLAAPNVSSYACCNFPAHHHAIFHDRFPNVKHLSLHEYRYTCPELPEGLDTLQVVRCDNTHQSLLKEALKKGVQQVRLYQTIDVDKKGRKFTRPEEALKGKKFSLLQMSLIMETLGAALEVEELRAWTNELYLALNDQSRQVLERLENCNLEYIDSFKLPCLAYDMDCDYGAQRRGLGMWLKEAGCMNIYLLKPGPPLTPPIPKVQPPQPPPSMQQQQRISPSSSASSSSTPSLHDKIYVPAHRVQGLQTQYHYSSTRDLPVPVPLPMPVHRALGDGRMHQRPPQGQQPTAVDAHANYRMRPLNRAQYVRVPWFGGHVQANPAHAAAAAGQVVPPSSGLNRQMHHVVPYQEPSSSSSFNPGQIHPPPATSSSASNSHTQPQLHRQHPLQQQHNDPHHLQHSNPQHPHPSQYQNLHPDQQQHMPHLSSSSSSSAPQLAQRYRTEPQHQHPHPHPHHHHHHHHHEQAANSEAVSPNSHHRRTVFGSRQASLPQSSAALSSARYAPYNLGSSSSSSHHQPNRGA